MSISADGFYYVFPEISHPHKGNSELIHTWQIMVCLFRGTEKLKIPSVTDYTGVHAEIHKIAKNNGVPIGSPKPTVITTGKNIGKKNETNCFTQAISQAESEYKKYYDKHNASRPFPMLLQNVKDRPLTALDFKQGITMQPKLNGIRAIFDGSELYSRRGKTFDGKSHILSELLKLKQQYPDMPYLDGELYIHGVDLPYLSGQARKKDDDGKLEYHIYDIITDAPYIDRRTLLEKYIKHSKFIKPVLCFDVQNQYQIDKIYTDLLKDGYEGAVLRKNWLKYEYGANEYHSPNVLKYKPVYDDEFEIVDYCFGDGKFNETVVWTCKTKDGTTFNVTEKGPFLPGSRRHNCYLTLSNDTTYFKKYICGLPLTVEYRDLIKGVPHQPIGVGIRTENIKNPEHVDKLYGA